VLQQEETWKRPVAPSRWHPEQYQTLYHEAAWRQIEAAPWLWSSFVWVGFDFPSSGRNEGDAPGINDKGLVTLDRKVRKDAYYWYQANWAKQPMVYITSRRFDPRPSGTAPLKVYSNGQFRDVTLKVARAGDLPKGFGGMMFLNGDGFIGMPPMPAMPRIAPMPSMDRLRYEMPELRRTLDGVRVQLDDIAPRIEGIGPRVQMELDRVRPQLERLRMEAPRIMTPRIRMVNVIV